MRACLLLVAALQAVLSCPASGSSRDNVIIYGPKITVSDQVLAHSILQARAGHFRYFLIFSIKKLFVAFFIKLI